MNTGKTLEMASKNLEDSLKFGELVGKQLKGSEVIELSGDVGTGKTVFARGIAHGAGSNDLVASPSFTISRVYRTADFDIHHFDFYRLDDPGLMAQAIEEASIEDGSVVVVEWSDIVQDVLPNERLKITIESTDENSRRFTFTAPESLSYLLEDLK